MPILCAFSTVISGNRPKNNELSDQVRSAILAEVEAGGKKAVIARKYSVNRSTINRTIARWNEQQNRQNQLNITRDVFEDNDDNEVEQPVFNTSSRANGLKSQQRSGRPPKLLIRDQRSLLRIIRRNPRIEYAELKLFAIGIHVSSKTIYRMMKKHGILKWRAKQRPMLSPRDASRRLA